MNNMTPLIVMLFSINVLFGQSTHDKAVILISASSTPQYIGEMKDHLKHCGLILNVEKEIWENQNELEEFAFTLTDITTKQIKSFHFKYNELNKNQVFLVYPTKSNSYGEVMTDVSYMRSELLALLISLETKRMKPILHRSYGKSGAPYRESIVLTDLKKLEEELSETIDLYKTIKADQAVGKCLSGFTYTYNGELLNDPAGINLADMTADVLIETLSDDSRIVNIWSDEPLNQLIMGSTIAGQR